MKKTVIIHTDALRREFPANRLLAAQFKAQGYRVYLSSRQTTRRIIKYFNPDFLVLSHVFSIKPDELRKLRNNGTKIYANEVEGEVEGNEVGISGTYPKNVKYEFFEGIFVWSEWSKRWLHETYGLPLNKVHAIGCTRLSLLPYVRRKKTSHVVGFLSRFEVINPFDGRHPFENLMEIDPFDARGMSYLERNNVDSECFSIGIKVIADLLKRNVSVIIRPHPNEDVGPYNLLRKKFGTLLSIDEGPDYAAFLDKVSVVLAPMSSAFTEPYLLNIPIVTITGLQNNKYEIEHQQPFVKSFSKAAHCPEDVESVIRDCCDPDLEAKHDRELDKAYREIYSLDKKDDPIDELLNVVSQSQSTISFSNSLMNSCIGLLKLLIDAYCLVLCIPRKRPRLAFRTLFQYHYNSLVHKPNEFMKRIDIQIQEDKRKKPLSDSLGNLIGSDNR